MLEDEDSEMDLGLDEHICVKTSRKRYNISLNEHCLFCLRRATLKTKPTGIYSNDTSNFAQQLEEVYSSNTSDPVVSAKLIGSLNKFWMYLQKRGNWDGNFDTECGGDDLTVEFSRLPTICYYCAKKLDAIHQLLRNLVIEVNKLGNVIRDSSCGGTYSWRKDNFKKSLNSSTVTSIYKKETLKFLESQETSERSIPEECQSEVNVVSSSLRCSDEIGHKNADYKEEITSSSDSEVDDGDNVELDSSTDTGDEHDPDYISEEEEHGTSSADEEKDNKPMENAADEDTPTTSTTVQFKQSFKRVDDDGMYTISEDARTGQVKFTCTINGCGKSYFSLNALRGSHRRKEHNIGIGIPCKICKEQCPDEDALNRHREMFHRLFRCDLCYVHILPEKRDEHIRAHVGDEYIIKCPNPDPKKCSKTFCTLQGLARHLDRCELCRQAKPDYRERCCEVCGFKGSAMQLRSHLLRHHNDSPRNLACPIDGCQKRFALRQTVFLHICLHAERGRRTNGRAVTNKGQNCDICKLQIPVGNEMETHLKEKHCIPNIIRCSQCPFLFSCWESQIDHVYIHRKTTNTCDICEEWQKAKFGHYHDLLKHYFETHHIGNKISCEQCGKEYFSDRSLKSHISRNCIPSSNAFPLYNPSSCTPAVKTFPCTQCNLSFQSKYQMEEHEIKEHDAAWLPCSFCEKKFSSFAGKNNHERKHRGTTREYVCSVPGCKKSYSYAAGLKNHISVIHEGLNPKSHVCDICGKGFCHRAGLSHHTNSVHLGLKPHMCDVCGENFSCSAVLKKHKLIHTGERPFVCDLCGQRFRQQVVLRRHVNSHKEKGAEFKPNGPMKNLRKRVVMKRKS